MRAARCASASRALPDVSVEPPEADGELQAQIVGLRRGRHVLPAAAARVTGPLGLGSWNHRSAGEAHELVVYPDLPTARRLALAVRTGRFRDEGRRSRGPLGLGTDFESIRDYSPDDDVRQLNWRATERLGRPMSNTYRVERDRDVVCVVDCGRLMASPLGDLTRLDAAVDAAVSVATVADAVGDRAGALAFDQEIRRSLSPRRAGGAAVVQALFDLEPRPVESDYELAFRHVGETKRAFVLVLTDLLDESAARPLAAALPLLARRHALAVASATDVDLEGLLTDEPERVEEVYRAAAAAEVLAARARVVARLRHAGALVIEAPAARPSRRLRQRISAERRLGRGSRSAGRGRPRASSRPPRARSRRASALVRPIPAGVTNPSTSPATTSHGAVPSTIASAGRASRLSASPRVPRPGLDEGPAEPQPGRARDDDAGELEHAVSRDQLEERPAVPGADREPTDRAQQHPVEDQHRRGAESEQDPGGESEQRHADVVRHDRGRERGLFVRREAEVLSLSARLRHALKFARARGPPRRRGRRAPTRPRAAPARRATPPRRTRTTHRSATRRQ